MTGGGWHEREVTMTYAVEIWEVWKWWKMVSYCPGFVLGVLHYIELLEYFYLFCLIVNYLKCIDI